MISADVFTGGIKPPSNAAFKTSSRLDTKMNFKQFYTDIKSHITSRNLCATYSSLTHFIER